MENASPDHEMAESSKDNVANAEGNGQRLNTPPTSSGEISSPANSSKRGRLRAASLVGSPARGLGNPSAGFGAGLQKVPSPITTITHRQARTLESTNANDMREPLPETRLPGITETLKELAPSLANLPPMSFRGRLPPVTQHISPTPRLGLGLPNRDSEQNNLDNAYAAPLLNIYARRADQIGPSHRIPGIGHLGDLLPPLGWEQGDDPITEAEAQRIFAVSRSQAKEMLDQSMNEMRHLSLADQEKLHAEKNAKYQTQRLLDEYLLLERVKLHKFWQGRRQKQPQQHQLQPQRLPVEAKPAARLQPLQPPAETSMIAYQRHQQSLVPASPHLYGPSPPLSGGTLNARIDLMMQGFHIPQASPISPTFLEPGLVPQTLEAVYDCHARNQVIIMDMNNENERFLTQWSAKFNVPRLQSPVAPGVIPFTRGQPAAPFGSIHYGYIQQDPRPWTPSQARFGALPEPAAQIQQARQSSLSQGNVKAPYYSGNRNGPFRYPGEEASTPKGKNQAINTPEPKKRGRTPKADKKKTWYDDEIAEANLPTSVITQAAMKAGLDFVINEDRKQTPHKPKGRRGLPVIDPKKGFAVSADAAKALIAKGAADARPRQQSVALASSIDKSATVTAPSTSAIAGHQAAFYPSADTQVISVPTFQRDEDTISAPNSAASGPSSDTPDDPKDTSYGQRAQRKPATTDTTGAPRKVTSTAGKKRKSTEAAPSAKKRTRHSIDGAADDE